MWNVSIPLKGKGQILDRQSLITREHAQLGATHADSLRANINF